MRVIGDADSKFTAQSMSPAGTNRTNRAGPMMSVVRGRLEMAGREAKRRFWTQIGLRRGSANAGRSALSTSTVTIDHAAPRDVPVLHSTTITVDMTMVCIDILDKILAGESQIERTGPLFAGHSGIRAGLKLIQN
jgi:hypothetical protein